MRGGRREGAGRPGCDRVSRAFRLRVEDAEFIRSTAEDVGISQSEVIHELIEHYNKHAQLGD